METEPDGMHGGNKEPDSDKARVARLVMQRIRSVY
jgi:hypothetical protein